MTAEFYGLGQSYDFVPRQAPKPAVGRRKLFMQERVAISEIVDSAAHQHMMGLLAVRAVRWFAESAAEIEWHTLQFEVPRVDADEQGRELAQFWRWSVWIH